MDCFATLAMTWISRGVLDTPHARGMTATGCLTSESEIGVRDATTFVPTSAIFAAHLRIREKVQHNFAPAVLSVI
jgi:hypothetical protein